MDRGLAWKDAEHITQAVCNNCDVFLTRDVKTIIRPHRTWLEKRLASLMALPTLADSGNARRWSKRASDVRYPHYASEFPHTVSGIRARSDLSAKHKEMILGRNAKELIRL